MMKKWWLIALVGTLALSLTSCSKKRDLLTQSGDIGFTQCDGTMGQFDVYVVRSKADPAFFELTVIPVTLDSPSDIAQITIANRSPSYKQMVREVVLYPNEEVFAGNLTETDLETFDILAITPFDGSGSTFLEQAPEKDAICDLPLPGQGVDGTGSTFQ